MDIYRVAFIGHRDMPYTRQLEEGLEEALCRLLRSQEYVEFYMGRNGDFDILAASAVKRAQNRCGHHNSTLILVLPYSMKDVEFWEAFYDEVMIPVEGDVHPKAAIIKRNEWMMDNADLLIAYVESRSGGAYTAVARAEKRGVPVLNLADV